MTLPGLLLAFAVLGLSTGQAVAESQPGEVNIHRLTESFGVKDGQRIRVVNHHGNIRIREVPLASDAELALTIQVVNDAPPPVQTRVEMTDDGVLEVGILGDRSPESLPGFLRMDLTLAVPNRVELDIDLADGDFTMHDADYPVRLRARTGSVRLRTSGAVDIDVMAGHVVYLPPQDRPPHGGRIVTSKAPVDILMNDPAALQFEVLSGAAITTDSPALLQSRRREGRSFIFGGESSDHILNIRTDEAPVRLVMEGVR